jgi:hypothetical protein
LFELLSRVYSFDDNPLCAVSWASSTFQKN